MVISYFIMDLNQQVKWLEASFIGDLEKHKHVHLVWLVVFYANVPYAMNQEFTTPKSCSYFIFVQKFKLVTWKQHYKTPTNCKTKQLLLKEKTLTGASLSIFTIFAKHIIKHICGRKRSFQ
jgi:hypothetical protein